MKHFFSSIFLFTAASIFGHGGFHLSDLYLKKYLVDPAMQAMLDKHSNEIFEKISQTDLRSQANGVWKFSWLPGYFVKYGLKRIKGMETIKQCIINNGLYLLDVPDKRVYHIKGQPWNASNLHYAVIVKEIENADEKKPLTLEHVRQLSVLIEKTHYVDLHTSNYVVTDSGKIFLIDTEGIFDVALHIEGYLKLFSSNYYLNSSFTPSALKFLFHQFKLRFKKELPKAEFYISKINKIFAKQKEPCSWDFKGYCCALLSGYTAAKYPVKYKI